MKSEIQNNDPQVKVSVIIPTYNRIVNVQKAIESVLRQTYTGYELIIIDDGSTDGTSDFISKKYPQIHLLRLSGNHGAATARNEGIKIAKGNYIAFLDSDDMWLPDYLKMQIVALEQDKDAAFAFCGCHIIEKDGKRSSWPDNIRFLDGDLIEYTLKNYLISTLSIVAVRKSTLLRAGLFNENLKICEDRELYLRLLLSGDPVYTPHILAEKFITPSGLMANRKEWGINSYRLLDIFFHSEGGRRYKKFETGARKIWASRMSHFSNYRYYDYWFAALMKLRTLYFSIKSRIERK